MENHFESPDDLQEEDTESEILDDDFAVDDPLDLMNVSPHDMEIGREMRLRGLSDDVLHLQTDPTRLLINPEYPHYNPMEVDIHVEDWAGFDLMKLPDTSVSSCGWNYGARCDFCNQMRPALGYDDPGPPCCRMRYHHVFNNPISGTRITLDLQLCEACMDDYLLLQINGNYEPV